MRPNQVPAIVNPLTLWDFMRRFPWLKGCRTAVLCPHRTGTCLKPRGIGGAFLSIQVGSLTASKMNPESVDPSGLS
jgi:hypothetical protein